MFPKPTIVYLVMPAQGQPTNMNQFFPGIPYGNLVLPQPDFLQTFNTVPAKNPSPNETPREMQYENKIQDFSEIPPIPIPERTMSFEEQLEKAIAPLPEKRRRQKNLHNPTLEQNENTGHWSKGEIQRFEEAYLKFGKDINKITEAVGTRAKSQVISHSQKFIPKLKKKYADASGSKIPRKSKDSKNEANIQSVTQNVVSLVINTINNSQSSAFEVNRKYSEKAENLQSDLKASAH